jgi:hypothetical protein
MSRLAQRTLVALALAYTYPLAGRGSTARVTKSRPTRCPTRSRRCAMDELVAFLRQCLDQDERVAREASDAARSANWIAGAEGSVISTDPQSELHIRGAVLSLDDIGVHIARWDPARVLAEVEAKRRIIADIVDEATWLDLSCDMDRRIGPRDEATEPYLGDQLAKLVAQPYAGRPGWRDDWAT